MTICTECEKQVPDDTPRPTYLVKATGKTIRPNPRCADCRVKYEKTRIGLKKVKD